MVKVLTDIDSDYKEQLNSSELVKGKDALDNMIRNLITTSPNQGSFLGERIFEPSYGCNLERYLFEPLDETTAIDIQDVIYYSVSNFLTEIYLPRNAIFVTPDYNSDSYNIYLYYSYRGDVNELNFSLARK